MGSEAIGILIAAIVAALVLAILYATGNLQIQGRKQPHDILASPPPTDYVEPAAQPAAPPEGASDDDILQHEKDWVDRNNLIIPEPSPNPTYDFDPVITYNPDRGRKQTREAPGVLNPQYYGSVPREIAYHTHNGIAPGTTREELRAPVANPDIRVALRDGRTLSDEFESGGVGEAGEEKSRRIIDEWAKAHHAVVRHGYFINKQMRDSDVDHIIAFTSEGVQHVLLIDSKNYAAGIYQKGRRKLDKTGVWEEFNQSLSMDLAVRQLEVTLMGMPMRSQVHGYTVVWCSSKEGTVRLEGYEKEATTAINGEDLQPLLNSFPDVSEPLVGTCRALEWAFSPRGKTQKTWSLGKERAEKEKQERERQKKIEHAWAEIQAREKAESGETPAVSKDAAGGAKDAKGGVTDAKGGVKGGVKGKDAPRGATDAAGENKKGEGRRGKGKNRGRGDREGREKRENRDGTRREERGARSQPPAKDKPAPANAAARMRAIHDAAVKDAAVKNEAATGKDEAHGTGETREENARPAKTPAKKTESKPVAAAQEPALKKPQEDAPTPTPKAPAAPCPPKARKATPREKTQKGDAAEALPTAVPAAVPAAEKEDAAAPAKNKTGATDNAHSNAHAAMPSTAPTAPAAVPNADPADAPKAAAPADTPDASEAEGPAAASAEPTGTAPAEPGKAEAPAAQEERKTQGTTEKNTAGAVDDAAGVALAEADSTPHAAPPASRETPERGDRVNAAAASPALREDTKPLSAAVHNDIGTVPPPAPPAVPSPRASAARGSATMKSAAKAANGDFWSATFDGDAEEGPDDWFARGFGQTKPASPDGGGARRGTRKPRKGAERPAGAPRGAQPDVLPYAFPDTEES